MVTIARNIVWRCQRGMIFAMTAIFLPLLVSVVGMMIDLSFSVAERGAMQAVADNAARSGAITAWLANPSEITDALVTQQANEAFSEVAAVAAANGITFSTSSATVSVDTSPFFATPKMPPKINVVSTDATTGASLTMNIPPTSGNFTSIGNIVEVIIQKPRNNIFSTLFGAKNDLYARAVGNWNAAPCILALGQETSGNGVSVSGGAALTASCGVYSNNKNSAASVTTGGSGTSLAATVISAQGLIDPSGNYGAAILKSNQDAMVNPYDNQYSVPSVTPAVTTGPTSGRKPATLTGTSLTQQSDPSVSGSGVTKTVSPGWYSSFTLSGGSNKLVLNPGVYYVSGDLSINGGQLDASGKLNADGTTCTVNCGVTIVMLSMSGRVNFAGGATITINPTTTGAYAGVSFFQKQSATPDKTPNNSFTGGSASQISGTVVLPNRNLQMAGGISSAANCVSLVGYEISFSGGGSIGRSCSAKGMNTSTFRMPFLLE